jgi:hypothetical protein
MEPAPSRQPFLLLDGDRHTAGEGETQQQFGPGERNFNVA